MCFAKASQTWYYSAHCTIEHIYSGATDELQGLQNIICLRRNKCLEKQEIREIFAENRDID